ncbi:hypothetical protein [Pseudonocardia broussonetiae]|uniref:Uncharacterized protein n=1 Tax=Pseudonocardia broussonetiae TaxID=2736640 RepID=A0A6M6JJH2_9PSEU|nr:hypothetical protein [Pseudonocardia broussonetiae]QJY48284.1 hypothetical protein HOP40_22860 [Pseudonocardia broussonetiae]
MTGPLGLIAAASVLAAVAVPVAGAPAVLLLLPVAAVLLTALRLAEPTGGPAIHDRQLDLIVASGAGAAAVVLLAADLGGATHDLGLLAAVPAAVAVLALVAGTRRLWHARAVPGLLLLAWPAPWAAATAGEGPVTASVLAGVAAGLALGVAVRTRAVLRLGLAAAATAAGALAGVAAVPGPVLAAVAALALVVVAALVAVRARVTARRVAPGTPAPGTPAPGSPALDLPVRLDRRSTPAVPLRAAAAA